jgi:thiamine pyrophosphate-dependent acetolactate synthase large subunit-like protein
VDYDRDFKVPMNNALGIWTALQRQPESKLIIWPNENYWILNGEDSRFFYSQVRDWFQRRLNAPSPVLTAKMKGYNVNAKASATEIAEALCWTERVCLIRRWNKWSEGRKKIT